MITKPGGKTKEVLVVAISMFCCIKFFSCLVMFLTIVKYENGNELMI